MSVPIEDRKKLLIITSIIFLATFSFIVGQTFASSIILTTYSNQILPYFYFSTAIITIIITAIYGILLKKSPTQTPINFKIIVLISQPIFILALKSNSVMAPFLISILLLSYLTIISMLGSSYASACFNIQKFKKFSKEIQLSSTVGAIVGGGLASILSKHFNLPILLALVFLAEIISLWFIKKAQTYTTPTASTTTKKLTLSKTIKKNLIFKNLAIITLISMITSVLIDYNLKLSLLMSLDKQKIASVTGMIYAIYNAGLLIVQFFFIDFFFRTLGSKKFIIISPLVILITTVICLIHLNFIGIAILFIINNICNFSTITLSKDLYLNILPLAVRSIDRIKLRTTSSLALILSSGIIFCLTYANNKIALSLILIILLCVYSLYLARILMRQYRNQLTESVYLRRFNPEIINMSHMSNNEVESLLNQALSSPEPESILFGLQLLSRNKILQLPNILSNLLTGNHLLIAKETAKILATHTTQPEFISSAKATFSTTQDEETRWYLALYLMKTNPVYFCSSAKALLNHKTSAEFAILCLIDIKNGNIDQQKKALESLLNMLHSHDTEQMKWFLYVLQEITSPDKEKYLVELINQGSLPLKILALQQIGMKPSNNLVDILVHHLGEPGLSPAVTACLIEIGDRVITFVTNTFKTSTSYSVKISCIQTLTSLGQQAEPSLIELLSNTHDVVIQTVIAKYLAYRGIKVRISEMLTHYLIATINTEINTYFQLTTLLEHYPDPLIQAEINSRLTFIKKRVLYYATAIIGSTDILNSVPLLTASSRDINQQPIVLELIDSAIDNNRQIATLLMTLFLEQHISGMTKDLHVNDPWLTQFINAVEHNNIASIYAFTTLRKIDLFKNLAAETLQVLAECCILKHKTAGEIIFNEGDKGDGLYIIDSGQVTTTKHGVVIAELSDGDYFGELALLADIPRFATITATTDLTLFYIDKQDFDKITNEIPEIMKNITKQVVSYLILNASMM